MALIHFLWRRLRSVLEALVVVSLIAAALLTWRAFSYSQVDDEQRLAGKQRYLSELNQLDVSGTNPPNIVFVLYDDLGYGDIGHGGTATIATPNIDAVAAAGITLTDFHAPAPVCTPSRVGFLTGRLAPRAALPNVIFPTGSVEDFIIRRVLAPQINARLPAEEITLADILAATGYRTGMVGKWHLGDRSPSLPNDMGFDYFFGALYSNDMTPFELYRNGSLAVPEPVDQTTLSELYARESEEFIARNANTPFFLYLAHNFPHDPLAVSDKRLGRSEAGLFGDVVEELDEGVGRIINALHTAGIHDNTLVIISSDNGPWFLGSPGGYRGRKGNTFEGGTRVPFIAQWPNRIPAGSLSQAMAMGTDLLPTVLDMLDLPPPPDRQLDGQSVLQVLTSGAVTPHDYLYHYDGESLIATRGPRFKYRAPGGVHYGTDQMPVATSVPQKEWLFDLTNDPAEAYDVSARHPEALARLRRAHEVRNAEMSSNPRGWYSQE